MTLPASLDIKTTFNLSGASALFNLQCLTDFDAEGITLNNIKQNFKIVNPLGITVYENTSLTTPDLYTFLISTITQSAGVATVTTVVAHGLNTGDYIIVGGATQAGYNIIAKITKTGASTFTYLVDSGTATPATGSPVGHKMSLNTVSIQTDTGTGFPIVGNYTVTLTTIISGGVQPGTYVKSFSYTYGYVRPVIDITQYVDCIIPRFYSSDTTTYMVNGVQPTFTRTQNITFPIASNIALETFATQNVEINYPKVWNGVYTTSVVSLATYVFSDGLNIYDRIYGQQSFTVKCDINLCSVNCCLNDLNEKYTNELTSNPSQAAVTYNILNRAVQLANLFTMNTNCGNSNAASENLTAIYALTGCTPDCGCGESGQIIPYNGFIGKTILEWNVLNVNNQYDYINYQNFLYKVLVNTSAGQNPTDNPTLYQIIGQNPFIGTNTASGSVSATLNKTSGSVTYTDSIPNNGIRYFTLNNSFFFAGQKIDPEIDYDNQEGGNGNPQLCNYRMIDGQAIFAVTNTIDGNATGSPVIIKFKIQQ